MLTLGNNPSKYQNYRAAWRTTSKVWNMYIRIASINLLISLLNLNATLISRARIF